MKIPKRFLDPRLAVGILLVTLGGVAGARLLDPGQTVTVLRAVSPIPAGSELASANLIPVEVDANFSAVYVGPEEIVDGDIAAHTVGTGEYLALSAVGTANPALVDVRLPLIVEPAGVGAGGAVDIWRVEQEAAQANAGATLASADAILVAVEQDETVVGNTLTAHVRVDRAELGDLLKVLGTSDGFALVTAGGQ